MAFQAGSPHLDKRVVVRLPNRRIIDMIPVPGARTVRRGDQLARVHKGVPEAVVHSPVLDWFYDERGFKAFVHEARSSSERAGSNTTTCIIRLSRTVLSSATKRETQPYEMRFRVFPLQKKG